MIPVSGFFVVVAGEAVCDDSPRTVVKCIGHRNSGFGLGGGSHFLSSSCCIRDLDSPLADVAETSQHDQRVGLCKLGCGPRSLGRGHPFEQWFKLK
jgi:hypothetical protein